jgi:hypothetical protein
MRYAVACACLSMRSWLKVASVTDFLSETITYTHTQPKHGAHFDFLLQHGLRTMTHASKHKESTVGQEVRTK